MLHVNQYVYVRACTVHLFTGNVFTCVPYRLGLGLISCFHGLLQTTKLGRDLQELHKSTTFSLIMFVVEYYQLNVLCSLLW